MHVEIIIRDKELYQDGLGLTYGSERASAFDLRSSVDAEIKPGETLMIDTGLSVWSGAHAEQGHDEGFRLTGIVLPRSGLGSKQGLVLGNLTGVIDDDYQGQILVAAWNRNAPFKAPSAFTRDTAVTNDASVFIKRGDRIAQYMFVPVIIPEMHVVEQFSRTTQRGETGFGSTGVK